MSFPLFRGRTCDVQKSSRPCENSRVSRKTSCGRPISEIFRALVDRRARKLDLSSGPRISPPSFRTVCLTSAPLETRGSDDGLQIRRSCLEALMKIAPSAVEAVPVLAAALGDPDYDVRRRAADALGKIGPPAVE